MRGKIVGKYRIEDKLGEGGMGTVYRAVHTGIGKRAAVKFLRGSYSDSEEVVQRFFNEARAAARIEHPGIIDVYDFGRHEGRAYLVMELLEGEPLSESLSRGALAPDTMRRITRQIAHALAAAHDGGITHRDLKPDNIFLVPDPAVDGGTRVKLLDFGIAKLIEADGSSSVETRTGSIIGTPVYMSPEQCRGAGEVDSRADLYSVGCIMFQMATGRPPFERAGVGELISAHLTEEPPQVDAVRADLDANIAALIMRLLAKSPDQRVASARSIIEVLDGELSVEKPVAKIGAPQPAAHLATLLPGDEFDNESTESTESTESKSAESKSTESTKQAPLATAETAYQSGPTNPLPTSHPSTLSAAAAESIAEPARGSHSRAWLAGLAVVATAATAGLLLYDRSGEPVSTGTEAPVLVPIEVAAPLEEPTHGLGFLKGYRSASGSQAAPYASPGGWQSAARDFEDAGAQPKAPVRWRAAAELCHGYHLLLTGKLEPALERMRKAAGLEPGWDLAKLGLARTLTANKRFDEAFEAAISAERISPDWWLPIAEQGAIHRGADKLERAVEEYQRALHIKPDEPLLLSAVAILYHALHMDQASIKYANMALAADPDMVSARLLLAERALEKADGKTALAHAERILTKQPRSANAKLAQADALLLLRKRTDARAAYRRALELTDELRQDGGPLARITEVRKALAKNRLPRPRHKHKRSSRSKKDGGRNRPSPGRHRSKTSSGNNPLYSDF